MRDHTRLLKSIRLEHVGKDGSLTGICIGDFVGLIRVQPDLLLATAQDAGRQALLEPEHAEGEGVEEGRGEILLWWCLQSFYSAVFSTLAYPILLSLTPLPLISILYMVSMRNYSVYAPF